MKAVYPGSFDPTTYGHLDIISRASQLFDHLVVAVLNNSAKVSMFSVEERVLHLKALTKNMPNVSVMSFSGLLVVFAQEQGAKILVRGLRAVTDFEYEFQMALTNRKLDESIETLFLSTSTQHLFLSSHVVKEVARFGGSVESMVPPLIQNALALKNQDQDKEKSQWKM